MFLKNKYTTWYYQIIDNRIKNPLEDIYTERHHIIPKSLGGNNKENLVDLSAREHFLVHWLLTKMSNNTNVIIKMSRALAFMMVESDKSEAHKWSKWQYEIASNKKREALLEARKNGWCPRRGKKHSLEAKQKMREAKLGVKRDPDKIKYLKERKHSKETKSKISEGLKGRPVSDETKEKLRKSNIGKKQNKKVLTCDICGAENYATQIKRYHNENCKILVN